jgi:hypothetical protein
MSIKNGHRAKAQIKRKKNVLQRMRTRELRKGLTATAVASTASTPVQADSKTEHAE